MWNQQETETLYQAIFHRKSVRKFKSQALSAEQIGRIEEQLSKLVPIFPEEKVAFRILISEQVKGRGTGVTHHLAVYAEQGLKPYTNAGFMLQQMDLWLSSEGIGSWWHGLAQPVNGFETAEGLPFAFLMTIGIPDEPVHRAPDAFRRKAISDITNIKEQDELFEALRVAPSATNRQPWYVEDMGTEWRYYCDKNNPMITAIYKYITYLDAGIGLCHLWLAAKAAGKEITFVPENDMSDRSKKSEYICTVKL